MKIKINPRAAKELAKEIEKAVSKKTRQKVKLDDKTVREMQRSIDKLGK